MSNSTSNALEIRPTEGGLYEVYWSGGGELPDTLKGKYTYADIAQAAIQNHYNIMHGKLAPARKKANA